jgi:membrane protease YdiL (CAAX protease family)
MIRPEIVPTGSGRLAGERPAEWLLAVGTLALVAFYYFLRADTIGVFSPERGWHAITSSTLPLPTHYLASALVLAVIPVLAAVGITGLRPSQLGLGLGDWRSGLRWVALGLPLAVLAGWIGSGGAEMRAVYPLDPTASAAPGSFVPYALLQLLYYGAWETLFRGVLLFGLRRRMGDLSANLAQTGLSVTAHFGRAMSETLAAFPAGLVFGWVALRTGSIWPIVLVHWVVGISCDWFILRG